MRFALFIATLVSVTFASAAFGADSLMPLSTSEIFITVHTAPPHSCDASHLGALTLDSKAHLCICDGHNWTIANSNEPCVWTPAAR